MPQTLSITRRFAFLAIAGLLMVGGVTQARVAGAAPPNPQITVDPSTGLVDGQTVQVSGTGFQPDQQIQIIECGAEVTTPPFIGATCTDYSVGVQADADGSFAPVSFTVRTTIAGSKWVKGHYVPATHDCYPTSDCYVHAYTTTRAARAANQDISFAE